VGVPPARDGGRRGGDAEEKDTATEGGSQRGGVSPSSGGIAPDHVMVHHLSSVDTDAAFIAGSTSPVYRPVGRWRRDLSHMRETPPPE
jgi:hypothetical protein